MIELLNLFFLEWFVAYGSAGSDFTFPTVLQFPCSTIPAGAGGKDPLVQAEGVRPERKNRNSSEGVQVRIEVVVVIDPVVGSGHPLALRIPVGLRRPAFNKVVIFILSLVGVGQHEIL